MKVVLSKYAGFCPGVKNADKTVNSLIENSRDNSRIFTLGSLIHNRIYNAELEKRGVSSIDYSDIERIYYQDIDRPMTVVIRTHGITKDKYLWLLDFAKQHGNFEVVDATCPYVKKIHKIAEENTSHDTYFLLFSDPKHPEAEGIMSYANGEKKAFSSLKEIVNLDFNGKTPILCSQTTQNLLEFKKIKLFLEKVCTNAIFFDTICSVTENRQNEAIDIAKDADFMIVIGGKDSSNTKKLYDLCKEL